MTKGKGEGKCKGEEHWVSVEIDLDLPVLAAPHTPWHHFHAFSCWCCGEGEAAEAEGVETDGKHLLSAQGAYLHCLDPQHHLLGYSCQPPLWLECCHLQGFLHHFLVPNLCGHLSS